MDQASAEQRAAIGLRLLQDELRRRDRDARFTLRRSGAGDGIFLRRLFKVTDAHDPPLPDLLMDIQFAARQAAYVLQRPHAAELVLIRDGVAAGAFRVDFSQADETVGMDLAVMPGAREGGLGWRVLCAWTAVSDRLRRPARLWVRPGNPAIAIYRRLGFEPLGDSTPIFMERPVRRI